MRRFLAIATFSLLIFSGCSTSFKEAEESVTAAPVVVSPSPAPARRAAKHAPAKSSGSTRASSSSTTVKHSGKNPPQAGLLSAAEIDDNLNLAAFQRYLKNYKGQNISLSHQNGVHLQVVDATGRGVSNAYLKIADKTYYTRTDGHFYFYPSFELPQLNGSSVSVSILSSNNNNKVIKKQSILLANKALQKITITGQQNLLPNALDLMFVIDTTGSMGDELRYIKTELKGIMTRIKQIHPETSIRYGLTVYRDKGDDYIVKNYKFKSSLSEMLSQLKKQNANGGGDYPEAMDAALENAVNADWGKGNRARLIFLIADAPPHSNNIAKTLQAAKKAHQKGIRIYPLGASGVADKAEYVMRNIALVSNGRYQFLTDDSGIGNSHQEPHVACYVVTRLNQLMTRTIRSELSGRRVEPSPSQLLRTVGKYDNGYCHLSALKKTN